MDYEIEPDESVSVAVVYATSIVTGRDPQSGPELAGVLDPDALDALFEPRTNGGPRTGGRLSFVYDGCRVTVDAGEYLTVQPLDPATHGDRAPPHPESS